jgi:hypothetical protein
LCGLYSCLQRIGEPFGDLGKEATTFMQ